jgi:hypothetical protein
MMSSAQPLSVLVADPDVETRGALSAFLSISARRTPAGSSSSGGSARSTAISA